MSGKCGACDYGFLVCKPYGNGDWVITCTNCKFRQVRKDWRRYQRRRQPRHDARDRRNKM